ncbi:MAG: SDR family oxidoreductase [Acidimicrobiales bacterium]|nr:SDR family oxidoreductase [Acidimicrobiales bacterium]
MELAGKVAIVTGGGNGIGEAMCRAFAAEGAKGVVVADLAGDDAQRVATDLTSDGADAFAVQIDAGDEADVAALVATTEERYGPVDLFAANAGIMVIGGVDVPDEHWERIWNVNVKSHIYAARAVLPSMLERGEGYLLHTASAAGLLTQLGSAPYSVTKHAVVALAEWLSISHGDAGITVSCLCPQAVATNMTGGRRRPVGEAPTKGSAGADGVLEAEEVATAVVEGLAREEFLILPHPEVASYEQRRATDRERWLRGMRRSNAAMMAAWAAMAEQADDAS